MDQFVFITSAGLRTSVTGTLLRDIVTVEPEGLDVLAEFAGGTFVKELPDGTPEILRVVSYQAVTHLDGSVSYRISVTP